MNKIQKVAAVASAALLLGSCGQSVRPGQPGRGPLGAQAVAGCGPTNLALNKGSLSSSNETGTTLSGAAFDGNTSTRWASAFSDPQWIYVNLGSVQPICGVSLQWEAAYGKAFQIQVSNDANTWTPVYSTTTGTGGTQDLKTTPTSGQYVRMYGTGRGSTTGTLYGYSLYEFAVYGPGTATNPSVPLNSLNSLRVTTPGFTDRSLRHSNSLGYTEVVTDASDAGLKQDATWKFVAGLADASCYSLQSLNFPDKYLRHQGGRARIDAPDGSDLFKQDATWCLRPALDGSSNLSLESKNIPQNYLRHRGGEVWSEADTGGSYRQDATWALAAPWATTTTPTLPTSDTPDFGPNVKVYEATTPASTIQADVDSAFNAGKLSATAQFGSQRYTFLFKPGSYGRVFANVGFYTTLAGLGRNPDDVTISGAINVDSGWNLGDEKNATQNFWRSAENLSVVPEGGTDRWAVSQAAPMRRVHIKGALTLAPSNQDGGQGYSSGGYLADVKVDGRVSSGSQQQWYTRDSTISGWDGGVWNMVFSGVQGAPPQAFPTPPHTTLGSTPVSREKPYLYFENGKYAVFVPSLRTNSAGVTWPNTAGTSIPLSQFYVARPSDSTATLNAALGQGLNLFFTPGVYHLSQTLNVTRANTVIYGLGFPALIPDGGVNGINVADVDGVKISGLLFDAGTVSSQALLTVGTAGSHVNHSANPISIQDVYFRIGGAVAGKATNSLIVNSDNTIIDHIWAWRADHGTQPTGWTVNTADYGVVVNGNNVLATGLFVEHYQKYQVLWNGQGGRTIFFQNEMPYDAPATGWSSGNGYGYAAYKVADSVTSHEAWGLGSYCFFNVNPGITVARAFEVPNNAGVKFHDLLTVSLGNTGTISNVINNSGGVVPIPGTNTSPRNVLNFP